LAKGERRVHSAWGWSNHTTDEVHARRLGPRSDFGFVLHLFGLASLET
jgi:hypothetical protein